MSKCGPQGESAWNMRISYHQEPVCGMDPGRGSGEAAGLIKCLIQLLYNRRMGGSFSIKSVLPALFPDDPSLDYHNLEEVHNGGEAMAIFPKIKDMSLEDQKIARKKLLKYCLRTFSSNV